MFIIISASFSLIQAGDYDFDPLRNFLEDNLDAFSGKVVVLIERDGQRLFSYQAGGFDPNTKIGIASATKWMAAAVIMKLEQQGWYDLDDRIGDYLYVMETAGKGDYTIRQAFSMSCCLSSPEKYQHNRLYSLEQSIYLIAQNTPFVAPPGSGVVYDGKGMQTVGYLAQEQTGIEWRQLAQTQIFLPCEMFDTDYDQFYPNNPAVAGGIRTTPNDYMRFLKMLTSGGKYNGTSVLNENSIKEMFSYQTRGLPILQTPFPESSDWFPNGDGEFHYALGSWVLAEDNQTGEITELCSPGAFGTLPWIDFKRDIYGIIFTDVPAGSGQAMETELHALQLVRNIIDSGDSRAVRIGIPGMNYYDPEFLSSENMMLFQSEGEGSIWLTPLDPETGFFQDSVDGKNILIDDQAAALIKTNNSGEFGLDAGGWSVFYTRELDGIYRIWRAEYDGLTVTRTVLTDDSNHRVSPFGTRNPQLSDCLMFYLKGTVDVGGPITWSSESAPLPEEELMFHARGGSPVQWIPGTQDMVISHKPEGETNHRLAIYHTASKSIEYLTDGAADISDPFALNAPELDGQVILGGVENGSALVVYHDTGGAYWQLYSRLNIPPQCPYTIMASPEAFAFKGKSFVSLQIEEDAPDPIQYAQIWVFGIEDAPGRRIALRCDDLSDQPLRRTDPEFYTTAHTVYIYYNVIDTEDRFKYQLWRCDSKLGQYLERSYDYALLIDLVSHWLESGTELPGDIYPFPGDGTVNNMDFFELSSRWLWKE